MTFDLERRRARMSAGELSDFSTGPRGSVGGAGGLWRAQLGARWHHDLREQASQENPGTEFEVTVAGELSRGGWVIALSGRLDQRETGEAGPVIREIKTVTCELPASEEALRADYPAYFVQLAAYRAIAGKADRCELVFVEAETGLTQTVALAAGDDALLDYQLDRLVEFLEHRRHSRERLLHLDFRPAFAQPREGQTESIQALHEAIRSGGSAVLFEAPTGFGKTGVLLESALRSLKDGNVERVLYLTGKSTGQLHVVHTLRAMTAPGPAGGLSSWHVRNKQEHCINSVFQCVREACSYLDAAAARWPSSGLPRLYLESGHSTDIDALREAGLAARICPYEITRAALAFSDVWVGDFNYVFSPDSRGLFYERPGFEPGRTLLVVDEAHNLPSRAADAHSHVLTAADAVLVCEALRAARARPEAVGLWQAWALFLDALEPSEGLGEFEKESALELMERLGEAVTPAPADPFALGPEASRLLWGLPAVAEQLAHLELPRLWWCPRPGVLSITCLDAGPAIGASLREFGAVVLATATPGPHERFAEACGCEGLEALRAGTPWRDAAYDVAVDLRVSTAYRHRQAHLGTTAAAITRMHEEAGAPVAVFFPSYAYAQAAAALVEGAALQPRGADLAAQDAWVRGALDRDRALFLVLGSGFAEAIDLLGGRVGHAVVVGPALPEVNAVQRARVAAYESRGRDAAFDFTYRIPGMQKVNQALGRLVRAPGQRARVLLHCRRFAEPEYERLLMPEYRGGRRIAEDHELEDWLREGP